MDQWCQKHLSLPFDEHGAWAAESQVDEKLLDALLADPIFPIFRPKVLAKNTLICGGWKAAQVTTTYHWRRPKTFKRHWHN